MTATPDILTLPHTAAGRVLLPYQEAWRRDESRMKIWEKARRIGATYAEANDATMSRKSLRRKSNYWFSSADESAAFEFADYCRFWDRMTDQVADHFSQDVADDETGKSIRAFCVQFPSGARITAMSSSPRRFRSKGGDVGLDEFAYHDDPEAMWDAAYPSITWGDSIHILSTHNGEGNLYHRFVLMGRRAAAGEARPGDMPFRVHRVTIDDAVAQGLVERINETRGLHLTREEFISQCRAGCRNEDQWNQEYLAIPSMEAAAWLPYDLIQSCEHDEAGRLGLAADGQRYIGMDIGETTDKTVIWTLERVGDVLWTRERLELTDETLSVKQAALLERIRHPRVVRACVDATGLGTQIAQEAERTGKGEGVKFSLPVKDELASPLRGLFEDRRLRIPSDSAVREDLHSVRMTRTAAGSVRFDAERTAEGHADNFWALALACHAAAQREARPFMSVW